jgi:hypothetical protein
MTITIIPQQSLALVTSCGPQPKCCRADCFFGEAAKVVNEMSQSGFKGFCWDIKHDKTSRDWDTSYQWSSDILFS